jgi:hypothetical protein
MYIDHYDKRYIQPLNKKANGSLAEG